MEEGLSRTLSRRISAQSTACSVGNLGLAKTHFVGRSELPRYSCSGAYAAVQWGREESSQRRDARKSHAFFFSSAPVSLSVPTAPLQLASRRGTKVFVYTIDLLPRHRAFLSL
jgi:hypothetical protein